MECRCGKRYNFFPNGNTGAKRILVIDPSDEDFRKGRVLDDNTIEAVNYRNEFLKHGYNLMSDFLILPTHYHPHPKKDCYIHAMQTITQAALDRKTILFVGTQIFTQLKTIWGITLQSSYLLPTRIVTLDAKCIVISTLDVLGDFLVGIERFKEMEENDD